MQDSEKVIQDVGLLCKQPCNVTSKWMYLKLFSVSSMNTLRKLFELSKTGQ